MTNRGIKIVLKLAALAIALPQGGFAAAPQAKPMVVTSVGCGNEHGLAMENDLLAGGVARGGARMDEHRESADAVLTGRACTPTPDPREETHKVVDLHESISVLTGDCRHIVGRACDGGLFDNGSTMSRNRAGTFQTISSWVQNRVMAVELSKRD